MFTFLDSDQSVTESGIESFYDNDSYCGDDEAEDSSDGEDVAQEECSDGDHEEEEIVDKEDVEEVRIGHVVQEDGTDEVREEAGDILVEEIYDDDGIYLEEIHDEVICNIMYKLGLESACLVDFSEAVQDPQMAVHDPDQPG